VTQLDGTEQRWSTLAFACRLAWCLHLAYLGVFAALRLWPLAVFNIGSVALFLVIEARSRRAPTHHVTVLAALAITEILVHQILCTHYLGWNAGFGAWLLFVAAWSSVLPSRALAVGNITAATATFVVLFTIYAERPPPTSVPRWVGHAFGYGNYVTLFAVVAGLVAYYMRAAERAERALAVAHRESEALLHNILPPSIAERLKRDPTRVADGADATVLFADLVGFTELSGRLPADELVAMLNAIFSRFDDLTETVGAEKIKTIGDAYMAAVGVPTDRPDDANVIAELALGMRDVVRGFEKYGLRMRIGVHCGPVVAGVIGKKKFTYDLWGDTVNTAARMESHGLPDEIQVSEAAYARLRERYELRERGPQNVKGKGVMETWLLVGRRAESVSEAASA
jgi:adenylate cyclase